MVRVLAEYPESQLTLASTVRSPVVNEATGLLYKQIKDRILGPEYELSVVFIGRERSRALNRDWRGKDQPATVLSFPLTDCSGELHLCPAAADRRAAKYRRSPEKFYLFLFIHGCFHLIGMEHGGRMEANEKRVRQAFGV